MYEPFWMGADRDGSIALSDEYEGGKERIVITVLASRFDCPLIERNNNIKRREDLLGISLCLIGSTSGMLGDINMSRKFP